jgi:hypothetical protein
MKTITSGRSWVVGSANLAPCRQSAVSDSRPVSNVEMRLPFLRKALTGDMPLIVSMSGARLGDAVLFAGRSASLALPLAARTGLSGRCLVVGQPAATAPLEAAATREGLLIETAEQFPADHSFELAVVEAIAEWPPTAARALDAVRGGGRIVVVAGSPREGLLARLSSRPPEISPDTIVETLSAQGWRRARPIGARDGLLFVEAFA